MSFEGYLKYSCLNYLSRLLKSPIASFNNSFMFPNMQLKCNSRTLKLSSHRHTDSAVIRNSFASFTREQWNQLSPNERKQILETKQHRHIIKQISLCSYNIWDFSKTLDILSLKLQKMSALMKKIIKKHEPNLFIIQKYLLMNDIFVTVINNFRHARNLRSVHLMFVIMFYIFLVLCQGKCQ